MCTALCIRGLLALCFGGFTQADLRMASQPKHAYRLTNQGTQPWKIKPWSWPVERDMHYRYMEPSTFKYKGLENQKKRNYDNFLRSNVDNEQDNRNFNDEDGKDHLPFRTMETAVFDTYSRHIGKRHRLYQMPEDIDLAKTMKPGESMLVPLRWNNPHSSEMEVNIWIFEHASKQPIVVPIRKPSCSGEGYQDNIVSFKVPKDFTALGAKIPGFKGCNEDSKWKCTLQIYSHSVESRTYSIGFPIIIPGHNASLTTSDSSGIQGASEDPWLDLSSLRDICLPATDPSATISTALPRWARLVSDVYNHAYQNSDYSPYSGQQHESISKNLQASAINKMETGNRGELGKSILPVETYHRLRYLRSLEKKIYKNYESLANTIIKGLGCPTGFSCWIYKGRKYFSLPAGAPCKDGKDEKPAVDTCEKCPAGKCDRHSGNTSTACKVYNDGYHCKLSDNDTMVNTEAIGVQPLATCFRCKEVGSTNTKRLETNTYIPSFQLSNHLVPQAKKHLPSKYAGLITDSGLVQIYVAAMKDLLPFFYSSRHLGIIYQEAVVKSTTSTMSDATNFKKRNAKGAVDGGYYAAVQAKKAFAAARGCPGECLLNMNPTRWPRHLDTKRGYCADGWLRGDASHSQAQCQNACKKESDCKYYCHGTGSKHWDCLRYSKCSSLATTLKGSDMSSYSCFGKPEGVKTAAWPRHLDTKKGFCSDGWLRGAASLSQAQCQNACKDESDCNYFCHGTGSKNWDCLRYSKCSSLATTLRGSDMSSYTCFGKPEDMKRKQAKESQECKWSKHTNQYSRGYTRLHRAEKLNLKEAQIKCHALGTHMCKAVTCSKSGHPCTLRAGDLRGSRSGEITYTRSLSCQLGLPEGSVERPLIYHSIATNVSGVCSPCVQFFGKKVHPLKSPALTPLSNTIMGSNQEPAIVNEEGQLAENPDNFQSASDRRRRRSGRRRSGRRRSAALIQKQKANSKKSHRRH